MQTTTAHYILSIINENPQVAAKTFMVILMQSKKAESDERRCS